MESDIVELKADVKEIKQDVKAISVATAENTISLRDHMMRTSLNEKRIEKIEGWLLTLLTSCVVALVYYLIRH